MHDPNASAVYTIYSYDGLGRTVSVLAPDGASTTTYLYQGNTVTVTDAAGKWKKFTTDALGNLVQVNEPNPAGGADYVTTYTYDLVNHLTGVSMTRATGTADAFVCVQREFVNQRHESGKRHGQLHLQRL